MENLKKQNGSFKGLIGECMFKMTRKNVILPRFFSKRKYFKVFGKYLNDKQALFLEQYWYSFDAIEILYHLNRKEVVLYEVKTKNAYAKELYFKLKMTKATGEIYKEATTYGFIVKIAIVHFYDDWNYEVNIDDFDNQQYCIDKEKPYDRHRKAT